MVSRLITYGGVTVTLLGSALVVILAGPAQAGRVPYFHDFLGGVCVREADLELAYLEGSKGVRPPPICLETPCEGPLTREFYGREILGRPASDTEWEDYQSMWALVCEAPAPPDALTMLLPIDYDPGNAFPASDPIVPEILKQIQETWVPTGKPQPVSYLIPRKEPNTSPPGPLPPLTFGGGGGKGGDDDTPDNTPPSSVPPLTTSGTPNDAPAPIPLAPSFVASLTAIGALVWTRRRRTGHGQS